MSDGNGSQAVSIVSCVVKNPRMTSGSISKKILCVPALLVDEKIGRIASASTNCRAGAPPADIL
jgi:hypothetical protein